MVTILNISNRPIGVAGVSILPDQEVKIKDKDAYCDAYDENGNATGKKVLLPGLVALKGMRFVTITEEKEEKKEEVKEPEKEPVKEEKDDFSSMTKEQLIKYAEEHGIAGVSGAMKKADIIAAIEESGK